jgi:galactokinase
MELSQLRAEFADVFGRPAGVAVQAPGRVNLIGEHTDYNDGFVLPIAIERRVTALAAGRDDATLNLASRQDERRAAVDLRSPLKPTPTRWANYCVGVADGLVAEGVVLRGADVLFDSEIPIGAGLSSSAALEVCAAEALLAVAGKTGAVPQRRLALLCQRAENVFAGAPCGIMDQSIVVMAKAGNALLLDCRSGEAEQVPFDDPGVELLVVDTRVKHEIGGGEYGRRRDRCASAAEKLGLKSLRDADADMVESAGASGRLDRVEAMRARHVVTEISRTLSAVEALRAGDYAAFGELMYASHASLRADYEVSCAELDAVVELARSCEGVLGARMTGGGFGGSAIVLVRAQRRGEAEQAIAAGFRGRFGRDCGLFATRPAEGAGAISC